MFLQIALRIVGYGLAAATPWIAHKLGATVGGLAATLGGVLLNKSTSTVIPRPEDLPIKVAKL